MVAGATGTVSRAGLETGVRMQPGEGDVHHRVVEKDSPKPNDAKPRGARTSPASCGSGVDVASEQDPNNEGPDLFDIPAPVPTPRTFSPNGARDKSEAPQHETNHV